MKEVKISIIVPVYKVESYLDACVESLLAQTCQDFEIILVDDASPDRCPQLCDSWAERDPRIRVIHQENAGPGPARNSGMKIAKGQYISFVDSDDWLLPSMLEELLQTAEQTQADITTGGHHVMSDGQSVCCVVHPLAGQVLRGKEEIDPVRKRFFGCGENDGILTELPDAVWSVLYRRRFLEEQQLYFLPLLSEDIVFSLMAYGKASCVAYSGGSGYCYRKDGQPSITATLSEKKDRQYLELARQLHTLAAEEDEDSQLRVKRSVIDQHRQFAKLLGNSSLPWKEQCRLLKLFTQSQERRSLWEGYPMGILPLKQRIFQYAVSHGRYGFALLLNRLRQQQKQ